MGGGGVLAAQLRHPRQRGRAPVAGLDAADKAAFAQREVAVDRGGQGKGHGLSMVRAAGFFGRGRVVR